MKTHRIPTCWTRTVGNQNMEFRKTFRRMRLPQGLTAVMLFALAGVPLTSGCEEKQTPNVRRLSPRTVTYLEGVAVPIGFHLQDEMGMDYESGGQRVAQHIYEGKSDTYAVRAFYREQMPALGWNRVSDQNVRGVIRIRFERDDEACVVQIEEIAGDKVRVQANVMPFERRPSEPPPRQPVP